MSNAHRIKEQKKRLFGRQSSEGNVHALTLTSPLQALLLNIPGWDWRRDDQAVCLNEIKYGMLAQSCLASGFFTLASNMITASDIKIGKEMPRWKQEYLKTSNKVVLGETLSPTFVGMTYQVENDLSFFHNFIIKFLGSGRNLLH